MNISDHRAWQWTNMTWNMSIVPHHMYVYNMYTIGPVMIQTRSRKWTGGYRGSCSCISVYIASNWNLQKVRVRWVLCAASTHQCSVRSFFPLDFVDFRPRRLTSHRSYSALGACWKLTATPTWTCYSRIFRTQQHVGTLDCSGSQQIHSKAIIYASICMMYA